jgi:hypothetical protein
MTVRALDPTRLVDLELYPVLDLDSPRTRSVVAEARAQLAAVGAAELPGFVGAAGVGALVEDAEALAPRAYHSGGVGTAYLELPDFDAPEDHPRRWLGDYGTGAVAYDLIPRGSPLRMLYEWDPLMALVAAILDRGPLCRYADPFGALNVAVMRDGDQLQWHFDQTDFVVSLAIQPAEQGGDFEVAPRVRSATDERYDAVAAVLRHDDRSDDAGDHGDRDDGPPDGVEILTLPMTPGTLLVFEGRYSLHRVSPIAGTRARHVGLLAYDTKPGTTGSDLLRMVRYGRTEPFPEPPERWPDP